MLSRSISRKQKFLCDIAIFEFQTTCGLVTLDLVKFGVNAYAVLSSDPVALNLI